MNNIISNIEYLNRNDLIEICKILKIDYNIYTYDNTNKLVNTKIKSYKYDLIHLIQNYIKNNIIKIIYYNNDEGRHLDTSSISNQIDENTFITFKNIKKIYNYIKKYFYNTYKIDFNYNKLSYIILNKYWSTNVPINIKTYASIHMKNYDLYKNNYEIGIDQYQKLKNNIIENIKELSVLNV